MQDVSEKAQTETVDSPTGAPPGLQTDREQETDTVPLPPPVPFELRIGLIVDLQDGGEGEGQIAAAVSRVGRALQTIQSQVRERLDGCGEHAISPGDNLTRCCAAGMRFVWPALRKISRPFAWLTYQITYRLFPVPFLALPNLQRVLGSRSDLLKAAREERKPPSWDELGRKANNAKLPEAPVPGSGGQTACQTPLAVRIVAAAASVADCQIAGRLLSSFSDPGTDEGSDSANEGSASCLSSEEMRMRLVVPDPPPCGETADPGTWQDELKSLLEHDREPIRIIRQPPAVMPAGEDRSSDAEDRPKDRTAQFAQRWDCYAQVVSLSDVVILVSDHIGSANPVEDFQQRYAVIAQAMLAQQRVVVAVSPSSDEAPAVLGRKDPAEHVETQQAQAAPTEPGIQQADLSRLGEFLQRLDQPMTTVCELNTDPAFNPKDYRASLKWVQGPFVATSAPAGSQASSPGSQNKNSAPIVPPIDPTQRRRLAREVLPLYGRADQMALRYQSVYLFAVDSFHRLLALAVSVVAYQLVFWEHAHHWIIVFEILALGVAGLLLYHSELREWQQKWLIYRHIAERLRAGLYTATLGPTDWDLRVQPERALPFYGGPDTASFASFDAMVGRVRQQVEPVDNLDSTRRSQLKEFLTKHWVEDQQKYHQSTAKRKAIAADVERQGGIVLFWLTVVMAVLHVGGFGAPPHKEKNDASTGVHAALAPGRLMLTDLNPIPKPNGKDGSNSEVSGQAEDGGAGKDKPSSAKVADSGKPPAEKDSPADEPTGTADKSTSQDNSSAGGNAKSGAEEAHAEDAAQSGAGEQQGKAPSGKKIDQGGTEQGRPWYLWLWHTLVGRGIVFLAIILPAWGAAAHAITMLLEDERIAARSERMATYLRGVPKQLDAVSTPTQLRQQVAEINRVVAIENHEWLVSLTFRRPELTP